MKQYAGATHRVSLVMRYAMENTFARFYLYDAGHTHYQEVLKGLLSEPELVDPDNACDRERHDWRVEGDGEIHRLWVDGRG